MTYYRSNNSNPHSRDDDELQNSYNHVFSEAQNLKCFDDDLLNNSRALFEFDGQGEPKPKKLDVEALVCGLPFANSLIDVATNVQRKLDKYLELTDRYWVKANNLACEVMVLKWPDNTSDRSITPKFIAFLESLNLSPFNIRIHGAQMHADGCVVLRGYDCGRLREVRKILIENFPGLPQKQSSWVHVPLGRITSQVGQDIYKSLINELNSIFNESSCDIKITDLKLVSEKQWYMVDREIIKKIDLMG